MRRAIILFALGYFIIGHAYNYQLSRIPGVL